MMGYWHGGLGCNGMIINLVISIAFLVGLVFLVIWIVKQLSDKNPGRTLNNAASRAIEIVKERYASGEINRDEYQKILNDLANR